MSRTAHTASRPSRANRKPPVPPPGGWSLMEAADILCPDAAALYRQGGEALEAAIGPELHGWAHGRTAIRSSARTRGSRCGCWTRCADGRICS